MTVLIVDDEPDIAALLVSLLELEGYRAVRTASGLEALELARRVKPDAILLDLSLPEIDGAQVLRHLKTSGETAAIPVIIVSAYPGRLSPAERLLSHGVFEKPFDLDELMNAVSHACGACQKDSVPAALEPKPLRRAPTAA